MAAAGATLTGVRRRWPAKAIAKYRNPVILGTASSAEFVCANCMPEKKRPNDHGVAEAPPHYHGHRERLRGRFREAGADALSALIIFY
jgi:hypothetical protein